MEVMRKVKVMYILRIDMMFVETLFTTKNGKNPILLCYTLFIIIYTAHFNTKTAIQ